MLYKIININSHINQIITVTGSYNEIHPIGVLLLQYFGVLLNSALYFLFISQSLADMRSSTRTYHHCGFF